MTDTLLSANIGVVGAVTLHSSVKLLREVKMSVYTDNGYEDRLDYLESLAEDYEVDIHTVVTLADLLGPEEDFDGLVTGVQDAALVGL